LNQIDNPDILQSVLNDLRRTMGKMEVALGLIDEAIVWINNDCEIEWCNSVFDSLVKKIHIEIIGWRLTDLLVLEELGGAPLQGPHPALQVLNQQRVYRAIHQIALDERPVEVIAAPLNVPTHPGGAIFTIRDISQFQEQEQMKLQSLALQSTIDAIAITDPTGHFKWVNRAFSKLTGYEPKQVYGQQMKILQSGMTPEKTYVEMWAAIKDGKIWSGELRNKRANGEIYIEEQSITPVLNRTGTIEHYIAIKRDITKRIQAEESVQLLRDREITIAARIQRTLLFGRQRERINGVQVAALSIPSLQVAGDFFDCFIHDEDCMDVVIGDVMGKGVSAALLGAATKSAILRAMSNIVCSSRDHHLPDPREIILSLHAVLTKELIEMESFVTLFYARFNGKEKTMRFVDCGHTRSIRCSHGDQPGVFFTGDNVPLGMLARETYTETEIKLADKDVVVLYSDGITEATNASGEMFGEERLLSLVEQNRHHPCEIILEEISSAAKSFNAQEDFNDDLTCMVIKIDENWRSPVLGKAEFTYRADLEQLVAMRRALQEFIKRHYHDTQLNTALDMLLIGVNEAATNVIQHGFADSVGEHVIEMKLTAQPKQVEIELCYEGTAFTGTSSILPVPEGHSDNGYGLYLMEKSLDAIHYSRREDGWNRLVIIKEIVQEESPQA